MEVRWQVLVVFQNNKNRDIFSKKFREFSNGNLVIQCPACSKPNCFIKTSFDEQAAVKEIIKNNQGNYTCLIF